MAYVDILKNDVDTVFGTKFESRDGQKIPNTDDVKLSGGAVRVDAAFLYADLAGSSKLAQMCPWTTTAKIIRAYLACATRLIRAYDGEIRSFDGDRVMGVFMGKPPCTDAVMCAREIDWCNHNIIRPKATSHFKSIADNDITIKHCVGVDYGEARAVRAGIRNNNDLIWIGTAPSLAAKLSDIREHPYEVYVSSKVYNRMLSSQKTDSSGGNIWEKRTFTYAEADKSVYRTKTPLRP